jgi:hypothetical protein
MTLPTFDLEAVLHNPKYVWQIAESLRNRVVRSKHVDWSKVTKVDHCRMAIQSLTATFMEFGFLMTLLDTPALKNIGFSDEEITRFRQHVWDSHMLFNTVIGQFHRKLDEKLREFDPDKSPIYVAH